MSGKIALLTCLASTLSMTGVIAFVHVVHYPLFSRVSTGSFADYHARHVRLTTRVVMVPMLAELVSSSWLVFFKTDDTTVGAALAWAGLAAAIVTWAATAVLSVPLHDRLEKGFDTGAHRSLVSTNRVRALAWVVHSGLVLAQTSRMLR